jgi:hypothetical protein
LIVVVPILGALAIAGFASWASTRAPGRQATVYAAFWIAAFVAAVILYSYRPLRDRTAVAVDRYWRVSAIGLVALGVGGGLLQQARIAAENIHPEPESFIHAGVVSVADWLRAQPDGAVLMAQQVAILHRLTGRRIIGFPVTADAEALGTVIRTYGVNYLAVVDAGTSEYYEPSEHARLEALMAAEPGCCRLIETVEGYRIYEVRLGR